MDLGKILAGLVTISVSALVTIRYLRVVVNVNNGNINNIRGDNNLVVNQTNNFNFGPSQNYSQPVNLIALAIALLYPFLGVAINSALSTLSLVGIAISFSVWWVVNQSTGWKRLYDTVYVVGTAAVCWLLFCLTPFLEFTASEAKMLLQRVSYLKNYGFIDYLKSYGLQGPPLQVAFSVIAILGVGLFFSCAVHMVFAFLKDRESLGTACRYTLVQVLGTLGFGLMATYGITAAIFLHNFGYLGRQLREVFFNLV